MTNPEHSTSEVSKKPERRKLSMKHKLIALGTGAAILTGVTIVGVNAGKSDGGEPTEPTPTPSATPTETYEPTETAEPSPEPLSEEISQFIETFGARYDDPVSVFYSEQYLTDSGELSALISDDYIQNYDFQRHGNQSELGGINFVNLPIETEILNNSADVSVELFNNSFSTCINRYMNLIAKNPTSQATDVIDDHFIKWCGYENPYAPNLLTTLKDVVSTYGSSANYSVAPAIPVDTLTDDIPKDKTIFEIPTSLDAVDENGNVISFSNLVELRINVDVFNNDLSTRHTVTEDLQIVVMRVPQGTTQGDPGVVSIGQR